MWIENIYEHVTTAELQKRLRQVVAQVMEGVYFLSRKYAEARSWGVVSCCHPVEVATAERMERAVRTLGIERVYAVPLDEADSSPILVLPFTAKDLMTLGSAGCGQEWCILPEHLDFVMCHNGDYFWDLAGPLDFLEQCVGPVEKIHAEFLEEIEFIYVDSKGISLEEMRQRYRATVRACEVATRAQPKKTSASEDKTGGSVDR